MARVVFPRVLAPIVGDALEIEVSASTVGELKSALEHARPGIGHHLFDATGTMRPHVLCFIGDESNRLADDRVELTADTEVRFVQAVSGG